MLTLAGRNIVVCRVTKYDSELILRTLRFMCPAEVISNTVEPLSFGQSRPTSVRMLEFIRNLESLVYNLHDRVIRVNSCILQGRRLVIDIDWAHLGQN